MELRYLRRETEKGTVATKGSGLLVVLAENFEQSSKGK